MACVALLSDDEDETLCPASAPATFVLPAANTPEAAEVNPVTGLRSVVIAEMDLADSSDDEMLPAANVVTTAPGIVAIETAATSPKVTVTAAPALASMTPVPETANPHPASEVNPITGLRSVVVAQMDLAESSDDEMLPTAKPAATAPAASAAAPTASSQPAVGTKASNGKASITKTRGAATDKSQRDSDDDDELLSGAPTTTPQAAVKAGSSVDTGSKRPAPADADADAANEAPAAKQLKQAQPAESGQTSGNPVAKKAATAAAKADPKDKKIPKDQMEGKVLEYMRQQNRPYNSQNVFDNLHGVVPKASVQAILDTLAISGQLVVKEYGKVKVYLPSQSSSDADSGDSTQLQAEVDTASSELQKMRLAADETRRKVLELRSRLSATVEVRDLRRAVEGLEVRLAKLKASAEAGGDLPMNSAEIAVIEEGYRVAITAWRKHKRLCGDVLSSLGEMTGSRKQQLIETYGVETDEDCGQLLPDD